MQQILAPVHHRFVPGRGHRFDSLAVAQPAHVRKIRRHQLRIVLHLPRPRHPRLIDQRQRHIVFPQRIDKPLIQPGLIANFQREPVLLRQLFQKWRKPRQKFAAALERLFIEISKLQQQRPQLFAQQFHGLHKVLEILVAIHQHFFVRNHLRHFRGKHKIRRRFLIPAAHRGRRRRAVKRAVHLYRLELLRVMRQIFRRPHPCWIKRSFPSRRGKRRRSQQ